MENKWKSIGKGLSITAIFSGIAVTAICTKSPDAIYMFFWGGVASVLIWWYD